MFFIKYQMSGRRLLTAFITAKLPFATTYSCIRAIHVLPKITTCLRHSYDESSVDRRQQFLAINESSLFRTLKRHKSGKKKQKQTEVDEESDEEDEDIEEQLKEIGGKNAKVTVMNLSSMRVDLVVKAGMNMSRAKAEVALYESKIRINGEKVLKKSMQVKVGDVIDVVRGPSPQNPDFITVSRLTVLSAVAINSGYRMKVVKEKSLTIENYEDGWSPVDSQ